MADSGEEKVFDPSSKKLRKLREQGQVPRSRDMTSAVPLLAILGYLVVAYPSIYQKFYQLMAEIPISQPPNFVDRLIIALQMCGALTAQILLPFIGLVVIVVIVINVVDTGGPLFTFATLQPNFAKFNPANGIKQIFSMQSLLELIKGLIKLIVLLIASWFIVKGHMNDIFWSPTCGIPCVLGVGGAIAIKIIAVGALLLLIGAAVDFALQRFLFLQEQRMTLTEMKQERKEDSGDPHVAAQRRRIRNEIAQTAGLVGINQANVIFVGPNILVALAYKPKLAGVPITAAKGTGAKAKELLAKAQENKANIIDDADLAAKLMEGRVGDVIPRPLFPPVARVLLQLGLIQRS